MAMPTDDNKADGDIGGGVCRNIIVSVHYYRLSMRAAFFIALQNLPGRDFYWSRQEIPQLFRIQTVANIKLTPNQGFRKVQKLMVLLQHAYKSRFIFVLPLRIQHEIHSGMSL